MSEIEKAILYDSRKEAGEALAALLSEAGLSDPLLLALPRGGVPVAEEISRLLDWEMDVLLVRKMATQDSPEFARGALAERGEPYWNEELLLRLPLKSSEMMEMEHRARLEIRNQELSYRHVFPEVESREVVVVDDGLATGWTARAAALSLGDAERVVGAFPVAPEMEREPLSQFFDEVVCPHWIRRFESVSLYYRDFSPVEDSVVSRALSQ